MRCAYVLWVIFAATGVAALELDRCDVAAAHPSDPDRIGEGVETAKVVTHVAIPACRSAVERDPTQARFHYQLGRAIVYWAEANGANADEGIAAVKTAADMGYRQAQFVFGFLKARSGDLCAAEPWYKAAADQGLKSARITYVNDTVAGRYRGCGASASDAELVEYLDGAQAQVSGYYENMLLAGLRRQLEARQ